MKYRNYSHIMWKYFAFFFIRAFCNRGISCYNIYNTWKIGDFS